MIRSLVANLAFHLCCKTGFCDEFFVCRMKLMPVDVSDVINVAAEFVNNICVLCDGDETDLRHKDSAVGQVCCQNTADEDNALVIHRSVEILTEYLRFLRNACANCPSSQSAIKT